MLTQVGKYQIIEKIGVGGFGSVYKGRDPFIKRFVAIKTCQSDEDELKKRFFREAEFAGNLHHKNITTIYDFGVTEEGVPYIVQEFLTGEDLDKKIKRKDAIPMSRKVEILMAVCEGLGYAHAAGIVHRDIKPANVRILEDGTVKIMDFGIAKSMVSQSTLTQTGITLGTAAYLAPEQIRGDAIDPRTDIFSLGVLAYELLAYQKPFTGDHISTVLYKILNEQPQRLTELDPTIPPALERLVQRTLEKPRQNRQGSCGEILQDLQAVAETLSGGHRAEAVSAFSPAALAISESAETIVSPPGGLSRSLMPPSAPEPPPQRSARLETVPPPTLASAAVRLSPPSTTSPMTSSLADVRIRHEDTVVSAPISTPGEEGGGALKIFLASLVVLLLLGGGVAYYLYLGPGARKPGAQVATGPATAPSPAPTAAVQPTAGPPPTPVPTPAPTHAPLPAEGSATFWSNYNATLFINGARVKGDTQPPMTRTLKPGRYRARFEAEGVSPVDKEFEVRPGENVRVNAELPARGLLRVRINYDARDAQLFLDGYPIGRGPLVQKMVRAGTHQMKAVLEGFETETRVIDVSETEATDMTVVMSRRKDAPAPK